VLYFKLYQHNVNQFTEHFEEGKRAVDVLLCVWKVKEYVNSTTIKTIKESVHIVSDFNEITP
jgi:hypothetical protein